MKMKTAMTVVLLFVSFIVIGQNNTNDQNFEIKKDSKEVVQNEKKWKKIEKQIKKSKKKFSSNKNIIRTSKVIDTIYLDTPVKIRESRLSDWK